MELSLDLPSSEKQRDNAPHTHTHTHLFFAFGASPLPSLLFFSLFA